MLPVIENVFSHQHVMPTFIRAEQATAHPHHDSKSDGDKDRLHGARIHPIAVLSTLMIYPVGMDARSRLTWTQMS